MQEILTFNDLNPYLLLQNGNYLYKIPYRDGWAVLKVYLGSRGFWGRIRKSLGNVLYAGQTSYMAGTRCRIEKECIALWRGHGFRVFDIYEDVVVDAPGCVPGAYVVLEYVSAPVLIDYMRDTSRPLDERFETYSRFLKEWSRRHDMAISKREPRLVHENGDTGHVMVMDDAFVWFDFEMVYRFPSSVQEYVSHEIIQYIWNANKSLPPGLRNRFLDETISGYPNKERLIRACDYFFNHPNPALRYARSLDRHFRKRAKKPTSKYNVAKAVLEKIYKT
ncbi:MAG: hypothetical protein SV775_14435 [Thermodesulfobacteriota bacterium]|nr:hypothetical protein [Thermodesulfobacteriota bacterium]